MVITMDRYEANWKMVEEGWNTHVLRRRTLFRLRSRRSKDVPRRNRENRSGSSSLCNRKGRQARRHDKRRRQRHILQLQRRPRALRSPRHSKTRDCRRSTSKSAVQRPVRRYARVRRRRYTSLTRYLVSPPEITGTMSEYPRNMTSYRQLRNHRNAEIRSRDILLERQQIAASSPMSLKTYVEIPSDVVPFEQRPWMKCAEITDGAHRQAPLRQFRFPARQTSRTAIWLAILAVSSTTTRFLDGGT